MKNILKKDPKSSYQFDLTELETVAFNALVTWKTDMESAETRTQLFTAIRNLTHAILCVGTYQTKYNIDPDEIAYEYALYLFERLIMGTFKPEYRDRFPFQNYITLNLKHVIITKNKDRNWHELLVDLEYLVNLENSGMMEFNESDETVDFKLDKQGMAKKLYKAIRIYYSEEEIRRLLPMTMGVLDLEPKYFLSERYPVDLRDFIVLLITAAKRLLSTYNINTLSYDYSKKEFSKIVSSSVRSTVFLSAVVNSEFFPRDFLLSLDIDSLYRLVSVSGGNMIRVPTKKELDALIGTVVAVSKVIMEGKPIKQSLGETKEDLGLMFPTRIRGTNIETYISKILEVHDVFGEDKNSDPIVHSLISAIKSIDKMLEHLVHNLDKEKPETILQTYKEISTTFKILTDGLAKIGTMAVSAAVKQTNEEEPLKEILDGTAKIQEQPTS